jgi:hypothetical protein
MAQTQPILSPNLQLAMAEANATGQVVRVNAYADAVDALGRGSVKDKDLTTPPTPTGTGHGYIIPAGASGAWATKAKYRAFDYNSAWIYFPPLKGQTTHVEDEDIDYKYDGANWVIKTPGTTVAPILTWIPKTANFTPSSSEAACYEVDATSGAITIALPAAAANAGVTWVFKRVDESANAVTLDPNGSELIDSFTTLELDPWEWFTLSSNGTNWRLI